MNAFAQGKGLPGMGYIFWREAEDGVTEAAGPLAKNIGPERTEAIRRQLGLGVGDAAFFLGGRPDQFEAVAGRARNEIGRELGLIDEEPVPASPGSSISRCTRRTTTARSTFSHNPFSMPQGGMEALVGDPAGGSRLSV